MQGDVLCGTAVTFCHLEEVRLFSKFPGLLSPLSTQSARLLLKGRNPPIQKCSGDSATTQPRSCACLRLTLPAEGGSSGQAHNT